MSREGFEPGKTSSARPHPATHAPIDELLGVDGVLARRSESGVRGSRSVAGTCQPAGREASLARRMYDEATIRLLRERHTVT
jgi:hypothetical protein